MESTGNIIAHNFTVILSKAKKLSLVDDGEYGAKARLIDNIEKTLEIIDEMEDAELKDLYDEFDGTLRELSRLEKNLKKEMALKEELTHAVNNGVVDKMTQRTTIKTADGTMLNDLLLGRKGGTLRMYRIPKASYSRTADGKIVKKLGFFKQPESRLTRFFEANQVIEPKKRTIYLKNGDVVDATVEYTFSELIGNPIMFMEFIGDSAYDEAQHAAFEECSKIILEDLHWNYKGEKIVSEYAQSSASEMRTLKGVFIRKDYQFSGSYLSQFHPLNGTPEELENFKAFMDTLRSLRGAEVLYTAMSNGAYLTEYKGVDTSPAKFMARMGMAQTSTKSLGNDFRVKLIGEIKFPWSEYIEGFYREYYTSLVDKNGARMYSDKKVEKIIANLKGFWKVEKIDGQNIIRASSVVRGFRKLNIKLTEDGVIGKLIQFRWAGIKGTALVVPDSWLDNATMLDGSRPYMGYDIIAESSSWKYTPNMKYWNGALAPELELVAISKSKYSSNLNYQFIAALDGDGNKEINIPANLRKVVDGRYAYATESMLIAEVAKAALGAKSMREDDILDDLDIDDYEKSLVTILAKALDACDDIIFDRSWRIKFINRLIKARDKMGYGKVPVEGANRFVMSDPTPFFRLDRAVPRLDKSGNPELDYEGNPLFDIVITDPNDVALSGVHDCYWDNRDQEAVLFRSPCVHPGEPQRVNLVGLDKIPDMISTTTGSLDARELFSSIKHIVVVNCFSFILDALGGADTDGDTVLVVTDPNVVELRGLRRAPMLAKITSETFKTPISPKTVKQYMVESLKDSGIGKITNYGTTWRDVELMVVHMPNPVDGKYRLPKNVEDALKKSAKDAAKALKNITDMSDIERDAAMATAAIESVNDDKKFGLWTGLVIKAAEANLVLVRNLQEMSINTAKSGIFVDFTRYPWLKLAVRATWHRPDFPETYDSWSPMGQVNTYAKTRWDELREWAGTTSRPLHIGDNIDWPAYREVYAYIRELKASFGTEMYELNKKYAFAADDEFDSSEDRDKARMNEFKDLGTYYNQVLRRIAVEIESMDDVSVMAYRATIDRDKDNDEGLSFVWSCWGMEFVDSLKHFNSGKASKKLVAVHMAKNYEDYTLQPGEYLVAQGGVRFPEYPDDVLAFSKVPDGRYEIMNYDETPYLLKDIEKKTVESMAASFKGVDLKLIGIKHQIYEGKALTRAKVVELLGLANYTVTITSGISGTNGEDTYIDAMMHVRVPDLEEPVCIGNIPSKGAKKDEAGYFAQALNDKVLKVLIPADADKLDTTKKNEMNRLSLKIVDIIEDLSV